MVRYGVESTNLNPILILFVGLGLNVLLIQEFAVPTKLLSLAAASEIESSLPIK